MFSGTTVLLCLIFFLLLATSLHGEQQQIPQVCTTKAPLKATKETYRVGILANRGVDTAISSFNATFAKYLTLAVGPKFDPPIRFELVPLPFDIDRYNPESIDFFFANPTIFSCVDIELRATSLVTLVTRKNVNGQIYHLDQFAGSILALADNENVNSIEDIRGKKVSIVSLTALAGGQLQFRELQARGVGPYQDPKQLIITNNLDRVVNDVLSGRAEVGFVRSNQVATSIDDRTGKPVDQSLLKTIDAKSEMTSSGEPFPFATSTPLYPEWNLASFLHVDEDVTQLVQSSMLNIADYAALAPSVESCITSKNCSQNACLDSCFTSTDLPSDGGCQVTAEVALTASEAMKNGGYAGWRTSHSYVDVRSMQQEIRFISRDEKTNQWACARFKDFPDIVSCPDGYYIKTHDEIARGCDEKGLECYGFQCICSPCAKIEDDSFDAAFWIPVILVTFAICIGSGAYTFVEHKKIQADSVWRVKPQQLVFNDPPTVLGRGTFGLVLLAEYRGTKVAVKRVLPPRPEADNKQKSRAAMQASGGAPMPSSIMGTSTKRFSLFESRPRDGRVSHFDFIDNNKNNNKSQGSVASQNRGKGSDASWLGSTSTRSRSLGRIRTVEYTRLRDGFVKEMRHLSNLRHPCITTVMGAVIHRHEEPMLVMEYMRLGSLYDLLHNETIVIDGGTVLPILQDVAQGLRFLHSADPQIVHGDLKAQNVLVDAKMRAKVADFGLSQKTFMSNSVTGTLQWMAPELLRRETSNTPESDVYSFGIVLYEIFSRKEPYQGEDLHQVLRMVANKDQYKRPPVPSTCPEKVADLMRSCLAGNPADRPTAECIDNSLKGLENDEVDPIATIVSSEQQRKLKAAERTKDMLLNYFPPRIADALYEGHRVEPQSIDSATVLFCDFVDMSRIQERISATKVSDLLHRLETQFDELLEKHSVFKVETVGDGLMAVTNVAEPQEKDHVARMAAFALDLSRVLSWTLVDRDDRTQGCVQMRIGMNTGPVVASVVGNKNPRFCVLGDTTNVASQMEKNSFSGQILCSDSCVELLRKQSDDFVVVVRGAVCIKGKNEMQTFWLKASRH